MVTIKEIINNKEIEVFLPKYDDNIYEWKNLKEGFPNELKKIVDEGFNKFFIHDRYDNPIPIKEGDKFCFLYARSLSFEEFYNTMYLLSTTRDIDIIYNESISGICKDIMPLSVSKQFILRNNNGDKLAEIGRNFISLCDFWHNEANSTLKANVSKYIDKVISLYKEVDKRMELDIYEMIKGMKNTEVFEIKLKTNVKKLKNKIITNKLNELENRYEAIKKMYEKKIKEIDAIVDEQLSSMFENILKNYEIKRNANYGWYMDVDIIPDRVLKNNTLYEIKSEYKDKYKISGIKIVGNSLYTPVESLHPNVNDTNSYKKGYQICTGNLTPRFSNIADIINMLKTINMNSAYQDIEEGLENITNEKTEKLVMWESEW